MALVDLDIELVRIRDYRTRIYFEDALKAYRAGAARAAISATWIAVAYDILSKYRELSGLGDKEATRFMASWDAAVQADNTSRLLEFERSLLDHAHEKMALFDTLDLRTLKRLVEDRHLCAHPTFANEEELYEPSDELVRTHMAAAIEIVLAQPPVQGRGIFNTFSNDLLSPGFPVSRKKIADYVEQKYLNRMRDSIVRNFGIVLAKSLIRNVPVEWESLRPKVSTSLQAVRDRRPADWDSIRTDLVRMMNEDDPDSRIRTLLTLPEFPDAIPQLHPTTLTALHAVTANRAAVIEAPQVLAAVELEPFKADLLDTFEGLEDICAAAAIQAAPFESLWPDALRRYAEAGSFRGAESDFDAFVLPFQPIIESAHLTEIFEAASKNDQISYAGGTPSRLLKLVQVVAPSRPSDESLKSLFLSMSMSRNTLSQYEDLWKLFEAQGWVRPDLK